jgi:hypothetical protein
VCFLSVFGGIYLGNCPVVCGGQGRGLLSRAVVRGRLFTIVSIHEGRGACYREHL